MRRRRKWQNDPVILERLRVVSELIVQGAKAHEIAELTDTNLRTVYRDIERVYELWSRDAQRDIVANRARSTEVFRSVQREALQVVMRSRPGKRKDGTVAFGDSRSLLSAMRLFMDAEKEITYLEGTRSTGDEIPIEVDVVLKWPDPPALEEYPRVVELPEGEADA